MLLELLKNSMRATVETHGTDKMPPIRIVIADSEDNEDVSVVVCLYVYVYVRVCIYAALLSLPTYSLPCAYTHCISLIILTVWPMAGGDQGLRRGRWDQTQ